MAKLSKALLSVALAAGVSAAAGVPYQTRMEHLKEIHAVHAVQSGRQTARFTRIKNHILQMIDRRINFLEHRKACIEKASNWRELRACRPHRPVRWHRPVREIYRRK